MKNLFKNPLFYINILLLVSIILISASINPNMTKLPAFAKKAIAAVQNILGDGAVNYVAAFTGVNQIGNSIIYDNGTNVGIGITNPSQKLGLYYYSSGPFQGYYGPYYNSGGDKVSAYDYWIQAAAGGAGRWASQLQMAGNYSVTFYKVTNPYCTVPVGTVILGNCQTSSTPCGYSDYPIPGAPIYMNCDGSCNRNQPQNCYAGEILGTASLQR